MFKKELLKAELVSKNMKQGDLANILGVSKNTISVKMNNGSFTLLEAEKIINKLGIKNPARIFFAKE